MICYVIYLFSLNSALFLHTHDRVEDKLGNLSVRPLLFHVGRWQLQILSQIHDPVFCQQEFTITCQGDVTGLSTFILSY